MRLMIQLVFAISGPSDVGIVTGLHLWARINEINAVIRVDLQIDH